jgi:multicomponent Na+:H+ antiporter subunit B
VKSLILRTTTRPIIVVLLLISVFLLLRGHDLPGGGFIGGLVAAAAAALYAIAFGAGAAAKLLRVRPESLVGWGMAVTVVAGLLGMVAGREFLTGLWWVIAVGDQELKLSTPLLFDVGVYLVVVGVVLRFVLSLEER